MNGTEQPFWVYLSGNPLFALALTLVAYQVGMAVYRACRFSPLANPVPIAVAIVVAVLVGMDIPFATYFSGAQFIHFLLGPATVALAVPLYRQWAVLRRSAPTLLSGLLIGSATAVTLAVGLAWLLGASGDTVRSIAPKSITTPVAMGIAQEIGGVPALAAVLVLLTGVTGATLGPVVMNLARLKDWRARGFAIGLASHGMGTGRAMQVNAIAGAFAGLAMGLNAILTALALPALAHWLG